MGKTTIIHIGAFICAIITFNGGALILPDIIKIINPTSRKIISYLFPRVEQLEQYYEACGLYVPFWLQEVAEENCQKKLNLI